MHPKGIKLPRAVRMRMRLLQLLGEGFRPSRGPVPAFDSIDAIRTFWAIGVFSPISRGELARRLGIGEGVMRSVLRLLVGKGLVRITKPGCIPAPSLGIKFAGTLSESIPVLSPVRAGRLTFNERAIGLLVRRGARRARMGIEQRDAAVRAGAMGATILVQRTKLHLTGSFEDEGLIGKDTEKELRSLFSPSEGDAIVLAYADDKRLAERGAWAAALTLMD